MQKFNQKNKMICLVMVVIFMMTSLSGCKNKANSNELSKTSAEIIAALPEVNGIKFAAKTDKDKMYFWKDGRWQEEFLVGINLGVGKPGSFPGEFMITYDEYYRWFELIREMGVNAIRVYTTQKPAFYNALHDYNLQTEQPLLLYHGIWVKEEDIGSLLDPFAENRKILEDFVKEGEKIIDVVHGNKQILFSPGEAFGSYASDVSCFMTGFIMGIEWHQDFAYNTNQIYKGMPDYKGQYLSTVNAEPFEIFLAEVGDRLIKYETEKYRMQRPAAFCNWVTTDPLEHPNDPDRAKEDLVSINPENIIANSAFAPGLFASYHVYPYYPEALNYDTKYLDFKDENGNVNTYQAYLKELKTVHTLPLIVGEFGIPTSRGKTHQDIHRGFNQGHVDETDQGYMLFDMFKNIKAENYAGGFMFTWQDEWFKRTWNNMDYDIPDRRPYWSNIQTSEQNFGLLSFDPGAEKSICYVDGNIDDWQADKPLMSNQWGELYVKSDEKYVYYLIKARNYDFANDTIIVPIDVISEQGNTKSNAYGKKFTRAAEFILSINGENNSRFLVDPYYDVHNYMYGLMNQMIPVTLASLNKDNGEFITSKMVINKALELPQTHEIIPFSDFETGLLKYGNANPDATDYKSLNDFIYAEGNVEIRIPWQLFNVMDPSSKKIMGDFRSNLPQDLASHIDKRTLINKLNVRSYFNIHSRDAQGFYFGYTVVKPGSTDLEPMEMSFFDWNAWETPTYHERLKPSYFYLKENLPQLFS